jgi:hypothetical protein
MILQELDNEIQKQQQKEGKALSRFERFKPYLGGTIAVSIGLLLLIWIAQSLSSIDGKLQKHAVLAEIGGDVYRVQELPEGQRSRAVIEEHISDALSALLWMSNRLPAKYGGGVAQPITVPGINKKVPKIIALAALNIVDENRTKTLKRIADNFPDIENGETKMLRIYHFDEPKKTEKGYSVKMYASLWTIDATNTPKDSEQFNRIVYLVSVVQPSDIVATDPLAGIVAATVKRGLMIDYLKPFEDKKNEQP